MDMEHIKPSTMSTFRATLYSTPHLLMSFIDKHILMLTNAAHNCAQIVIALFSAIRFNIRY